MRLGIYLKNGEFSIVQITDGGIPDGPITYEAVFTSTAAADILEQLVGNDVSADVAAALLTVVKGIGNVEFEI